MGDQKRTRGRRRGRAALVVAFAETFACLTGCRNLPSDVSSGQQEEGQVILALTLPGGAAISTVSWTVQTSTGQLIASGATNTSRAGATASFGVGLKAGTGDVVTMTATTSTGEICSGSSAPFDVVASHATPVSVALNCQSVTADAGLGSVVVTGTVVPGDNCPALGFWSTSPETAAANGGQIDVTATATDADSGDTLTFQWSAAAGSFADPASATTTYACAAAGAQVLHLIVSDNHAPTPCSIDVAFPPVTCD